MLATMHAIRGTWTAIALLAAGHAHAQTPPAADASRASIRHTSAHADRVVLAPTAETHPEGTVFLSSYEIVLLQAGYAPTDRLQTELTFVPFFADDFAFAEWTLKANVLRSRWLRAAVLTAFDYARVKSDDEEDVEGHRTLLFGRLGGTLQLCFELRCRTSLSLSTAAVAHAETDLLWPLVFGAGFVAHMSDEVTLLVEYSGMLNVGEDFGLIGLPIYLASWGVRLSGDPSWALDLALTRALESDDARRKGGPKFVDVLGVPLVAFTYRFNAT
jgi:hypothetical protein